MGEKRGIGYTLANLPMWLYFGLIILAMSYITLYPLGFPIPLTSQTKVTYAAVDALQPGDIILMDQGYGSGTIAFHEPGFIVVFRHAMDKGAKIVVVSTSVESPLLLGRAMEKINPEAKGYVYGVDWVHLGYIAGGEPAYASVLGDINALFSEDYEGTPTSQLPLMAELEAPTQDKIDLVYIMTAGGEVVEGWIRQSAVRYDHTFITQVNEMMVPSSNILSIASNILPWLKFLWILLEWIIRRLTPANPIMKATITVLKFSMVVDSSFSGAISTNQLIVIIIPVMKVRAKGI